MLTSDVVQGAVPWLIFGGILLIVLIAGIAHLLGTIAAAATGIAAIKNILSIKQMLAGRQVPLPSNLDRPIDLVGTAMLTGVAANPLIARVSAVIAAVLLARKGGNTLPQQYVTDGLARRWASNPRSLPPGFFMVTELHARPIAASPTGSRMLVWFTASGQGTSFVEYWTFVCTAAEASLPPHCPSCGAPTAGNNTNTCRFCNATLWQPAPGAKTYWLVDDISAAAPSDAAVA